jgi:DNA-binding MarR family transcriptional regulator
MSNDIEASVGLIIGSTRRVILKELNAAFIEHNIPLTIEQYIFLHTLKRQDGEVTQQDMANVICKDKSAILRTIDVLEKMKLVQRLHDSEDRRKKILQITPRCEIIFDKILEIENCTMKRLTTGISQQDYEAMVRVMTQIQENAGINNKADK